MISIIITLLTTVTVVYNYFNHIASEALLKSFNSTLVADVYELKFENLKVDIFEGSIRVFNVDLLPREKPLHDYPYINSSFRLTTENLMLEKVEILTLLKTNDLHVEKISITKPEITLMLTGQRYIMLPFKDSTVIQNQPAEKEESLGSLKLSEFQLIDADFHVINDGKQREYKVNDFDFSLYNLGVEQTPGKNKVSFDHVTLSIADVSWDLEKGVVQHVGFKDFKVGVDSLAIQLTLDTVTYRFNDFRTGMRDLDIQTSDSLFDIKMKSFNLSYLDKTIKLEKVSLTPNVSHAVLQWKHKFQHTEFSGSIALLELKQVNFDSLLYVRKLFIDEINLDSVKASLFRDKLKPMDSARRPVYLGQTVSTIKMPILIKEVTVTNVHLENTERKPDSTNATVNITNGKVKLKNITNLSDAEGLVMEADAYINGKALFTAALTFSYKKPQFTFKGEVSKFNLPDLNPLILAYTPAKINAGIADEISFSGRAEETTATGSMKFLYHDLEVDLELHKQAKWKSSVLAFAANTVLNKNNPVSGDAPPRIVQFHIDRDMTKGFVNVLIKSLLNGLKETMIMSKENRKANKELRKK